MLTIEMTVLPSPEQWGIILMGMRNPMNSWDRIDSQVVWDDWGEVYKFLLGDKDHDLMTRLANGGAVHAKYRRMIPVFVTINAPLYWWKEFDTYKVGTVANSCSTMHKIHAKEFTLDDFSHEQLMDGGVNFDTDICIEDEFDGGYVTPLGVLEMTINSLNLCRTKFLATKDKKYWWQMIQLLPTSYNQKRTVMLNYEVLVNIYKWRHNHKLDEWHTFCDWIRELPYSDLIIGGVDNEIKSQN